MDATTRYEFAAAFADDWGLAALTSAERHDLLEVLEGRTERAATLITSQVPVMLAPTHGEGSGGAA